MPCGHFWRHLLVTKGGKRIPCRKFRELLRDFPALSFEERAKEDRTAKMFGNVPLASMSDHERLRFLRYKSSASTVAARQSPQALSALACCPSLRTIAPGARRATPSLSDIFTVRDTAGLRPAKTIVDPHVGIRHGFFLRRKEKSRSPPDDKRMLVIASGAQRIAGIRPSGSHCEARKSTRFLRSFRRAIARVTTLPIGRQLFIPA